MAEVAQLAFGVQLSQADKKDTVQHTQQYPSSYDTTKTFSSNPGTSCCCLGEQYTMSDELHQECLF
jgi:hypothetical protein